MGFDYIKLHVCTYYKWDFFKEKDSRPFTDWVILYFGINTLLHDKIKNVDLPLAELSGEIAGGLFNPTGLKEYSRAKEAHKRLREGKSSHEVSSDGGYVVSNNTIQGDKIVDSSTGKEIMKIEDLEKIIKAFR